MKARSTNLNAVATRLALVKAAKNSLTTITQLQQPTHGHTSARLKYIDGVQTYLNALRAINDF